MILRILAKIIGDKSLKALLRLRAENRELERDNDRLRKQLKERSNAMKAIVRAAKEHCDDIFFY